MVDKLVAVAKVIDISITAFIFVGILCVLILYVPDSWLGHRVPDLRQDLLKEGGTWIALGFFLAPAGIFVKLLQLLGPPVKEIVKNQWLLLRDRNLRRLIKIKFKVARAIYGAGGHYKTVTGRLRDEVTDNRLDIEIDDYNVFFAGDPLKGVHKKLWIWYTVLQQYDEKDPIHLPLPQPDQPPHPAD